MPPLFSPNYGDAPARGSGDFGIRILAVGGRMGGQVTFDVPTYVKDGAGPDYGETQAVSEAMRFETKATARAFWFKHKQLLQTGRVEKLP